MKRSRRVVLTMMGTAAVGAVSIGFANAQVPQHCDPGFTLESGANGRPFCRPIHGGFGGRLRHFHGHSHGHAGG